MVGPSSHDQDPLLLALAQRLRELRDEAGLTLAELAERSKLSRRYLTELEAGRANPSLLKLARLAQAYRVKLSALCDLALPVPRNRRVALVGLRGAGKSTVGRALALELEQSFHELDRMVEELSGLELAAVFAMHGEDYYRRLEREALEDHLERAGSGVLATGGSLVTHEETWQRLRETCFVVWLKATPEDHWSRVVSQGDFRPMSARPRARQELEELLADRERLYADADLAVETSGRSPEEVVSIICRALEG
jgi:XRE family transcriptional regulator, aerobic/anaerobic benzoate catabolism transcriptional regulator